MKRRKKRSWVAEQAIYPLKMLIWIEYLLCLNKLEISWKDNGMRSRITSAIWKTKFKDGDDILIAFSASSQTIMMFEENFFNKNMMLMKEKENIGENLTLGGMMKKRKIAIFLSNHNLTLMSRKNLTKNNYKYIMIKSTLIVKEPCKKLRVFLKIIKLRLNLISEDLWWKTIKFLFCMNYDLIFTKIKNLNKGKLHPSQS